MNDERPIEDPTETRQVERDSQLSAMFDGELPAAECELLARRLTRDDALRSQWSRYSLIGAALRAERGVRLDDRVARRVQAALAQDPSYGESADSSSSRPAVAAANAGQSAARRWVRFTRPAVGAGIAAGVAAVSIFWLSGQNAGSELQLAADTGSGPAAVVAAPAATVTAPAPIVAAASTPAARSGTGEPERYSTPVPSSQTSLAPPARLANYVVAHSEYSGPLTRRMALLSVVGSENQSGPSLADDADPNEGGGAPDAP